MSDRPNVILVFGDQWRAQATGFGGDAGVRTPHLDRLAGQSIHATQAVSGCPVCSPARACLLTGQRPLAHGVFVNDVHLADDAVSLGKVYGAAGYDTAWIGKWHVDGRGRSNPIPLASRQGFDYWKALECTHTYDESPYYEGDSTEKHVWEGYDASAQTRDAQAYLQAASPRRPFLMVLSWGPPHAPYDTAPQSYRRMYDPRDVPLRPNVPAQRASPAREQIAGYYAHCTALDDCAGDLLATLEETGLADDTIFVFFSDHGDMLGSQGSAKKQQPWEESIRVPWLLRWPARFGRRGTTVDAPIDIVDLMPTLLGLCGLQVPDSVEGLDFSGYLADGPDPSDGAALLMCPHPFGQWLPEMGGREYRGLRTRRHTYVRALAGPWLLYDNQADPFQLHNLVDEPGHRALRDELDAWLQRRLDATGDEFLPGRAYLDRWGYQVDERGTVPYTG